MSNPVRHNQHECLHLPHATAPEVMLYMDINGTVTCKSSLLYNEDATQGKLQPELLTEIYRSVTRVWQRGLPAMSFMTYVENHLHPMAPGLSNEERNIISLKRNREYEQIFSRLNTHEATVLQQKYQTAFSKLKEMDNQHHKVFSSFIKAIQWLKEEKKSFQVLLRTYGSDASIIMKEVNERLGYEFFDHRVHKLTYSDDGQFRLKTPGSTIVEIIPRKELAGRLYRLGNSAISDDYHTWLKKSQVRDWGKPFPIDSAQHSFFFDDWDGPNAVVAPIDAITGKIIPVDRTRIPLTSTFELLLNDKALIEAMLPYLIKKHKPQSDKCGVRQASLPKKNALC